MIKRYILSMAIISFALLSINSFPQSHLTFVIETIYDVHPQYITTIKFIDNFPNVPNEFNIIKNNPFNNLPFLIISKNGDQNSILSSTNKCKRV
jgi:hypothetical protein